MDGRETERGRGGRTDVLNVRLPRGEIERLRALAGERGYSLSELVRIVCRRVLAGTLRVPARRVEVGVQRRPHHAESLP